jgi:hypothetical protein
MRYGVRVVKIRNGFTLKHNKKIFGYFDNLESAYEMRLFYAGIKPSLKQSFSKHNLPLKIINQFHHIISHFIIKGKEFYSVFFFQNEGLKQYYMESRRGQNYFVNLGELFGYPPVAILDFLDRQKELSGVPTLFSWKRIFYHGISFVCKEEHVQECLDWLNNEYVIPSEYQVAIRVEDPFSRDIIKSREKTS